MIKDFFTGNFNVSVADKSRLQKSAYVKCWRLQKGLSINLEGNLVFEKKKENRQEKWRKKHRGENSSKTNLEDVVKL